MARQLRIQYPGAFYHVTSRGNEAKDVFKSKTDREKFLSYLTPATERYGARIHVYCLMSNHYHLLLETPDGNLSQIMRHINGAYTTYFNTKRRRSGHLFQGRFHAILVEADEYATELSRYIHLNPVRAGIVDKPVAYPWSSYPCYAGGSQPPGWLVTDFVLGFFGGNNAVARKAYRKFVDGLIGQDYESPLQEVVASTILGSLVFIQEIQERYAKSRRIDRNVPALAELAAKRKSIAEIRDTVQDLLGGKPLLAKKVALYICHRYSGRKLKEIGAGFDVGESAVSQNSRRFAVILDKDKTLRKQVKKINRELALCKV